MKTKQKQFPLYISEEHLNNLREEAESRNVSLNALIKIKLNLQQKMGVAINN